MKTNRRAATAAAIIALSALAPHPLLAVPDAATIPSVPDGELSAYPTVVQTGTKPTLTWNINYPLQWPDVPPGDFFVTVQIVGTGVTACDSTQGAAPLYTEVRLSLNGGSYVQLFYGVQSDVLPGRSLYIKKVRANDTLDFGGRFVKNGSWSPFYTTRSFGRRVVRLANGDEPPTTFPLYQSSLLAGYLKPYLDASGKISIGPLSVLVMMELGQADPSLPCFDYQDQLLLVSYSKKHPNNGHGNNLDGVDSSNPGQGHGGPNGMVDPSGGVDDEAP